MTLTSFYLRALLKLLEKKDIDACLKVVNYMLDLEEGPTYSEEEEEAVIEIIQGLEED